MTGPTRPRQHRFSAPAGRFTAAMLGLLIMLGLPGAFAAFTATTANRNNRLTAAAAFPTYPAAVIGDGPIFYYRLEEPPGTLTAADSSGNGQVGMFSSTQYDRPPWTGVWPLDDGSGTTARDLSGSAAPNNLTLYGGAAFTASGRSRSALRFNGSTAYAATATPTVTTNATRFTMSAWVYLTDLSVSRTALSQDGVNVSGFELGYDQPTQSWVFAIRESDNILATSDRVLTAVGSASLGTWTNLTATATYNSGTGTTAMVLFVNGVPASATNNTTPWNATGPLVVGARRSSSTTLADFWKGDVDTVRSNDGQAVSQMSAAELTVGVTGGSDTTWNFDEGGAGTTTADISGNLNTGTLVGATFTATQRRGPYGLAVNGTSSQYVTGAAAARTTGSFSVAAWVLLSTYGGAATSAAVVSQVGTHTSGFSLRYQAGRWTFAAATADTAADTPDTAVSAGAPSAGTWTHLLGVYDNSTGSLKLFVNGAPSGAGGTHSTTWNATTALNAGRDLFADTWTYGLNGAIDDVRVFRRALDQAEVTAVYQGGGAGTTLGARGALQGPQQGLSADTAMAFGQAPNGGASLHRIARAIYNPTRYPNPTTFTVECWFRSSGTWPSTLVSPTHGLTLISFSPEATGNPVLAVPPGDRRLYLDTSGRLGFGTTSGSPAQTTTTYFDGNWHHAAATADPTDGIKLYVDGTLTASAAYTTPANITGYWRWGGDTWPGWNTDYYNPGLLDEPAVYNKVLTDQQIAVHYHANH